MKAKKIPLLSSTVTAVPSCIFAQSLYTRPKFVHAKFLTHFADKRTDGQTDTRTEGQTDMT